MTTWNELTHKERSLLTVVCEWGGWINSMQTDGNYEYDVMIALKDKQLIEYAHTGMVFIMRATSHGEDVWQQGQAPDELDELTRLREQVEALTAERDALVQAAQAVIEDCKAARVEPIHLQALRAAVYRVGNE